MDHPDFNKWLIDDLKTYLLQHDIVLEKGSGKNGNVIKSDLVKQASKAYKADTKQSNIKYTTNNQTMSGEFPEQFNDLIPSILNNLNAKTLRSLNKSYYQEYSKKRLILNFMQKQFHLIKFDQDYNTQEKFNNYEIQQLEKADDDMITYLYYLMYFINIDMLYIMDKYDSVPVKCVGFILYAGRIVLLSDGQILQNKEIRKKHVHLDKRNIYKFIKENFPRIDYDRLVENYYLGGNVSIPSYKELMNYQKYLLSNFDDDMNNFLQFSIMLIGFFDLGINYPNDPVTGFLCLADKIIFTND